MTNDQDDVVSLQSVPNQQFRAEQLNSWASSVATSPRRLLLFASVVMLGVFGAGGFWAATAKIGGAVTGIGRVVASGNNRIVQHLEGGIIKEITAREGDVVKAGDPLAQLDVTRITSQLSAAQIQRAILAAELQRWRAESADSESFDVPEHLLAPVADHPRVVDALNSQRAELAASVSVRRKKLSMLASQIESSENQIRSFRAAVTNFDQQMALIQLEHNDLVKLLEKGLTARPRVLALERAMAQIAAQRSTAQFSIAQSESSIQALREEQLKVSLEYVEVANQNVSRLQKELNALEDVELRMSDLLARSIIRAPSSGIIFRIYKKTEGAVLGAGESFAEIFPDQEELNVEVFVKPQDITNVELDQDVSVVFQSDHRAHLVPVSGRVKYISTDTFVDELTGAVHYVVQVSIRKDQEDRRILPGNTAEAFFATEPKTFLELVSEPLTRFAFRSFKG